MIKVEGEIYLLACEAAEHLNVSRSKFYNDYRKALKPSKVGQLKWKRYRMSDLDRLQVVETMEKAS